MIEAHQRDKNLFCNSSGLIAAEPQLYQNSKQHVSFCGGSVPRHQLPTKAKISMKLGLVEFLLVSGGAILGALLRYLANGWLGTSEQRLPLATLVVNLVGSFLIGWLYGCGWLSTSEKVRLFAAVGLLGSLTTFSAFSLETFRQLETGQFRWAFAYVLISTVGGLLAVAAGVGMGKWWR
jgi:CrcB protein